MVLEDESLASTMLALARSPLASTLWMHGILVLGEHETGRDHTARLEAREWKGPVMTLHHTLSLKGSGELNDFRLAPFDCYTVFWFLIVKKVAGFIQT